LFASSGAIATGVDNCTETTPAVLTAMDQGRISVEDIVKRVERLKRLFSRLTKAADTAACSDDSTESGEKYVKSDEVTGLPFGVPSLEAVTKVYVVRLVAVTKAAMMTVSDSIASSAEWYNRLRCVLRADCAAQTEGSRQPWQACAAAQRAESA
jgi:hypothetical protein